MTDYYVATSGGGGSNANPGTEAEPWLTIDYAVDNVAAGDTIYVRGGSYNARITLSVTGTAGNYITLRNYTGETPTIDGTSLGDGKMLTGDAMSYYKFIGLTFDSYTGTGIYMTNTCSYIEVRDCTFSNSSFTASSSDGKAIWLHGVNGATYNGITIDNVIIDGNTFSNLDTGGTGAQHGAVELSYRVQHFEITNNSFDDITHRAVELLGRNAPGGGDPSYPQYGYVANNTISNASTSGTGTQGDIWLTGAKDVVIENNTIDGASTGLGSGIQAVVNDALVCERLIIRDNKILRKPTDGITLGFDETYDVDNVRVAHNSFYQTDNGSAAIRVLKSVNDGTKIFNNLFEIPGSFTSYQIFHDDNEDSGGTIVCDYNIYNLGGSASECIWYWQFGSATTFAAWQAKDGTRCDPNGAVGNPDYVDPVTNDLTIGTASAAINAGGFLTTTNGTGSSSTTLIVDDSYWFSDGHGVVGKAGDTIQVNSDKVVISSINYSTHTITLATAISWSDADPVSYLYGGSAPNAGSYQGTLTDHYYGIYTDGNGAGASIANIKAGTGTGYVTHGSSLGELSGALVTFNPTALPGGTPLDLEYLVEDEDANITRADTVNFQTLPMPDFTPSTLSVVSQTFLIDRTFPLTQSTLTVTGQTVTLNTVALDSQITFTLNDRADGTPYASVTGIEYALWLDSTLGTIGAPALQGTTSTDVSGVITITTTGTFNPGQEVIVALRKPLGGAGGSDDDWALGSDIATAPP